MPDLDLTPSDYHDLGVELGAVAREFADANARSDDIRDAVGHGRLGDTVHDFAHSWDDTRGKMTGDIKTLGAHAKAIGDAFTKQDGSLADSVSK